MMPFAKMGGPDEESCDGKDDLSLGLEPVTQQWICPVGTWIWKFSFLKTSDKGPFFWTACFMFHIYFSGNIKAIFCNLGFSLYKYEQRRNS